MNGLPKYFYVKCVEDSFAVTVDGKRVWEVKEGEKFKVHLHEESEEYFTTDSENREVFVGGINNDGVLAIDEAFRLLPVGQFKFNYIYG